MAILIDNTVTTTTPEQQTILVIDNLLQNLARQNLATYNKIRGLIYNNQNLTPEAVYIAFNSLTKTGLTDVQLGESARIIKSLLNRYQSGIITDDVPEATINV